MKLEPFTAVFLAVAGAAGVSGCGGQVTSRGTSSSESRDAAPNDGVQSLREPAIHRDAGAPCPAERGPGCPSVGLCSIGGDCASDTDCNAGLNGRCITNLPWPLACSYDTCASDSDCPARTPCQCRSTASDLAPNECVADSTCAVDSDCGPQGFCSPSGTCTVTYHCHTAADTCVDDGDCSSNGQAPMCLYDTASGHWACAARPSCPHAK
jgi:hypothetical protein